jgi:hypothetical protein
MTVAPIVHKSNRMPALVLLPCLHIPHHKHARHFSAVHVHIEAAGGAAIDAALLAAETVRCWQAKVVGEDEAVETKGGGGEEEEEGTLAGALEEMAASIAACTKALRRMEESCDPYIYYHRVRLFMAGWTSPELPAEGMHGALPFLSANHP